jgi:hypothetical protein
MAGGVLAELGKTFSARQNHLKPMNSNQQLWSEVSKTSPCPLCGKPDWCNVSPDREAVQCGRTDNPPPGWRLSKISSDGRPLFVKNLHQSSEFLEKEEELRLRRFLRKQGKDIPGDARITKTIYHYSREQQIHRYDWPDPAKNKGRDKTFIMKFFDPQENRWKSGRGNEPWFAYNESDALRKAKDRFLVILEGEKCVDLACEIGLPATTLVGSNWAEEPIRDLLEKAQNAGVKKIIYWADGDPPGREKAAKIQKVCTELRMPVTCITNKDLIPEAGEKDDIEEAISLLGKESIISFLQGKALQTNSKKLFFSVEELQQSIGEKTPLLEDLFDRGDTVLIAGKPGAGKSVFATILVSCIENGIPFMGRETAQLKTAIINVDQSLRVTIGYVQRYCPWAKKPLIFDSRNLDGIFDLRDPSDRESLVDDLVRQKIEVICLDSWRASIGDSDENASSSVYPLIQLKKELEPHKISLVLVHHANKIGESRGSNALEGAVDVCLLLKVDSENPRARILKCYKNRLNEIGEWRIFLNSSTGNYEAEQLANSAKPELKPSQKVLKWLNENALDRAVTAREIQGELGLARTVVYEALSSLTDQGKLTKIGNAWSLARAPGENVLEEEEEEPTSEETVQGELSGIPSGRIPRDGIRTDGKLLDLPQSGINPYAWDNLDLLGA